MNERKIKKIAWITLILVYLVILAGSVVRMTGSGMGCPDWPKCFGQWVPPTDEAQLPSDYRESFAEKRIEKIDKFCSLLESIGLEGKAKEIKGDPNLRQEEASFNAAKTWTEYINRLVGFFSGNFMLLQTILLVWWLRRRKGILFLGILNLVLLVFQAWFGSIVVATNLLPEIITIHMFIALLIVAIQIIIIYRLSESREVVERLPIYTVPLFWVLMALILVQVYAGTQLRQLVDVVNGTFGLIETEPVFKFHRSFAWAILVIGTLLWYLTRAYKSANGHFSRILLLVLVETIIGVILAKFDLPDAAKPFHLLIGSVLFGYLVYTGILLHNRETVAS